jgi:uncharacterized protein with von Willebrand factor type A (vWA) domain
LSTPFAPRSLEDGYAALDDVPESLLGPIVTLPLGDLHRRITGLLHWRTHLLQGRLPSPTAWPGPAGTAAHATLTELGIARFCRDAPDLVDELLGDLLRAWAGAEAAFHRSVEAHLAALESMEWAALEDGNGQDGLTAVDRARLQAEAEALAQADRPSRDAALHETWAERVRLWSEVTGVFGDLGERLGRGRDLSIAILRHTGWTEVVRLRALVEQLASLREVIETLGRLQEGTDGEEESIAEAVFEPVLRSTLEQREVRAPDVPAETTGVRRSDDIARMLPAEAALLAHPKLRLLWHARRAERALLTYELEGHDIHHVRVEREERVGRDRTRRRPRPVRGPILTLIDTSGSMHGLPETVAKALVLEAMRTALREERRCFLVSFSGPQQVDTHELSLTDDGLAGLLGFLGMSFHGGTDLHAPLLAALEKLGEEAWTRADVLLVSDGGFSAPRDLLPAVAKKKDEGTRFHGVQIGQAGRTGMHAVCDPVHTFRDWAALRGC